MCGQTCPNYPKQKTDISPQYLKTEVNDEVDFLHAGKNENLLQIDTMILMEMVKNFQSSQNSKFTMSVQYLKKEDRDEIDFWHADKYESGLQVDFNILGTKNWLQGDTMIVDKDDEVFSNYLK